MFQVKICGITSAADACAAIDAGADAIGLNFYPRSVRYVSPDLAATIARAVAGRVSVVGVFVDADLAEVQEIWRRDICTHVQYHGEESPGYAAAGPAPWVKAFRCQSGLDLEQIPQFLGECRSLATTPAAVLLDSFQPGLAGGTGHPWDWRTAARADWQGRIAGVPWILAGGLTPEGVAEAIAVAGPAGVDVASGVESEPGRKDPRRMAQFVQAARDALALRLASR